MNDTLCRTGCSTSCVEIGASVLNSYLNSSLQFVLNGTFGPDGPAVYQNIQNAITSAKCSFPKNVKDRLTLLITQITTQSSTIVKDVLIYAVAVIFLTLLLLIMCIYLTFYIFTPGAMLGFFILSFIIIVIAVLALYFGILGIYNNGANNVNNLLIDIQNLFLQIECSGSSGLCCLASIFPDTGCTCITCPT